MTIDYDALAQQHGFSRSAIEALAAAIANGNGTQAQFNHPELGGMGQWMAGGMVMIGDAFNTSLKARVDAAATSLAGVYREIPTAFPVSGFAMSSWWPKSLGEPAMTGGQNEAAYAYFPRKNRLAIKHHDTVILHDTTGHTITGVAQQQDDNKRVIAFRTETGTVTTSDLPTVQH